MIHRTWLADFRRAAGVQVGPDDLLDIGGQFLKALDEANDAFDDAIDTALEVRIKAQDRAEDEFLNALAAYEKSHSG